MEDQFEFDIDETIIRYLEDSMDPHERNNFESQIASDNELRKQFEEYKLLLFGINKWGDHQLKESIKNVDAQLSKSKFFTESSLNNTNSQIRKFTILKYSAVAAILAGIVYFTLFNPVFNKEKNSTIYTQFYAKDTSYSKILVQEKNTQGFIPNSSLQDSFNLALVLYKSGNFSLSKQIIESLNHEFLLSPLSQYYIGLNCIELGEWDRAFEIFDSLCDKGNLDPGIEACWYHSLLNIKLEKDKTSIVKAINKAIQSNTPNSDRAKDLLKKFK